MSKPVDDVKRFDVRCHERNIKYGLITHKDVNEYLASLPDVRTKAISLGEIEDRNRESRGN